MPPKRTPRKDKPVPLEDLRFVGDADFILARLKASLAERDQYINKLENENAGLEGCASKVWIALEEAEGMANRYSQFVQDALDDPAKSKAHMAEMVRYERLFREARGDFQRLRP